MWYHSFLQIINIIISLNLIIIRCFAVNQIYQIIFNKYKIFNNLNFFNLNRYRDNITNNTDYISLIFISIVLIIRGFTFLYTSWYVGNRKVFTVLVYLFVCRMLLLIIFTNLWIFIWGWDFLGVVSYLLVISYQNQNSNNAGMITVLSNRVGDSFMIISLSLLRITGNWNRIINNNQSFSVLLILIFLTRITKSAQIPFCAWLPAAMAAPTPVSALVHSSTLVTAGVYLIMRFNQNNPSVVILITGIITTILAGINACNGFDFKKLIALSTLSQLGLMFIALGLGLYKLALYHLVTHGLVKALLFLSAGTIIHQTQSNQDLRIINGLCQNLPLSTICIILTSLTLSGLPFMTCFFSKEVIVSQNFLKRYWVIFRIFLAASLTINYSLRLVYRILNSPNFWNCNKFSETTNNTYIPLLNLLPFTIIWGTFSFWFVVPYTPFKYSFNIFLNTGIWVIILLAFYIGKTLSKNKNWGKRILNRIITNILFLPLISRNYINKLTKIGFLEIKNHETSWSESIGAQGFYFKFTNSMTELHLTFLIVATLGIVIWIVLLVYLYSLYLKHNIENINN